ncbi:prostate stem cell antigen-like [Salarias fasciatus]|uniref:Prostate stem cell antigen-like n=1 Tax=Salarias fasciatus TaxID=181472 RepID=A0A672IP92_SALFA|nr:prostate stem cell antigen-like [Salarias fasciatus]
MNRIIVQLLVVGFCFAMVHALRCYECKFGISRVCITTKTTCESGEQCFSGEGTAVGFVPITLKGCLKIEKCNKTTEESIPAISNSTVYSMTKTCCDTDLCNAAPGLPGAPGLGLLLASVSALFVANLMA